MMFSDKEIKQLIDLICYRLIEDIKKYDSVNYINIDLMEMINIHSNDDFLLSNHSSLLTDYLRRADNLKYFCIRMYRENIKFNEIVFNSCGYTYSYIKKESRIQNLRELVNN